MLKISEIFIKKIVKTKKSLHTNQLLDRVANIMSYDNKTKRFVDAAYDHGIILLINCDHLFKRL